MEKTMENIVGVLTYEALTAELVTNPKKIESDLSRCLLVNSVAPDSVISVNYLPISPVGTLVIINYKDRRRSGSMGY